MLENNAVAVSNKTVQHITDAFLELLNEKHYSRITVTEVAAKVGINRATFYRYFLDVYDLFEKTEKEYYDRLIKRIENFEFSDSLSAFDVASIFPSQKELDAFKVLTGKNGSLYHVADIFYNIYKVVYNRFREALTYISDDELAFYVTFLINGGIGMYEDLFTRNAGQIDDAQKIIFTTVGVIINRNFELAQSEEVK